jgi:multiple antibiotic resistance protein
MIVILVLLLNMLLTYWILSFSKNISKILGKTGINVLTRIFAILLTALACQFIIDGIIEAFRLLM